MVLDTAEVMPESTSVRHPSIANGPYCSQFGDGADVAYLAVWPLGIPVLWLQKFPAVFEMIKRPEGEVQRPGLRVILLSIGVSADMIGYWLWAHCYPNP